MLDPNLVAYLEGRGVPFCLIGGLALGAWGVARYTADADLLTLDPQVLESRFWERWEGPVPLRSIGDEDDPLAGVVRFPGPPTQDLIVGKGPAARVALQGAVRPPVFPCPVAEPLGLILLKLEAGGPQDGADILALLANAPALGRPSLAEEVQGRLAPLSPEARAYWALLSSL